MFDRECCNRQLLQRKPRVLGNEDTVPFPRTLLRDSERDNAHSISYAV